jgi:ATP-binding cassette, subfamily B, bacterial MsbA
VQVSQSLQRGLAGCEGVFALIDEIPEVDSGLRELGRAAGRIELVHASFTYAAAERPAIRGIDLAISAGETVALVGASGSGKTTLANLIPRFYTPQDGKILLDGVDLRDLTLTSLRANIALVSQDIVLFNDTLAANIAYGRLAGVSRDAVRRAAQAAHALSFIEAMPQGLDTLIGENGVRMSGGQRQRLAIARAFLKDAPVLILDEATSALDSESERHVQEALEVLMQGRTTLVIAHRLSTIERADRIVVLHDGAIVEMGRHAELVAREGPYARLYRMQYERAAESAE